MSAEENVQARYQVVNETHGLIETFAKKKEAFRAAAFKALTKGESYDVFDVMAKKNAIQTWTFKPDGSCIEKRKAE